MVNRYLGGTIDAIPRYQILLASSNWLNSNVYLCKDLIEIITSQTD